METLEILEAEVINNIEILDPEVSELEVLGSDDVDLDTYENPILIPGPQGEPGPPGPSYDDTDIRNTINQLISQLSALSTSVDTLYEDSILVDGGGAPDDDD